MYMIEYLDVAKLTCMPEIWLYHIIKAVIMPR